MTMIKSQQSFPCADIKKRAFSIYPKKGVVIVDGFKRFRLKELKNIELNIRLSFPHNLFVAIDKA